MAQMIDMSTFNPTARQSVASNINREVSLSPDNHIRNNNGNMIDDNITMLRERYPSHILFTQHEAAAILKVSYEFVRKKVVAGQIKSVSFGTRKQIHFQELAKLLSRGI